MNIDPLFAAGENPYQILGVKLVLAIVGLIMLGVGIYALKNKRLLVSRRAKFFLKIFGKEEITGLWAIIGGVVQCLVGVCLLTLPIAGPYVGMFRSDSPRRNKSIFQTSMPNSPGMDAHFGNDRPEYEPLPELDAPVQALPDVDAGEDRRYVALTTPMGFVRDGFNNFEHEMAPAGGALVGVRVCLSNGVNDAITSITPVFQTADEYSMNAEPSGEPEGEELEIIAKPGFVVVGARVNAKSQIQGIQLRFRRLNEDGTLGDEHEGYWSDTVGEEVSDYDIENKGAELIFDGPVVGLSYRFESNFTAELEKLSFAYVDPRVKTLGQTAELALPLVPESANMQKIPGEDSGDAGYRYSDNAPAGAMMVGLQCDNNPRGRSRFTLMRPIYQKGDTYLFGEQWGPAGGTFLLFARPGYAVSGCNLAKYGRGLQLVYSKVMPSGHLDINDSYESEWLGDSKDKIELKSESSPVVGWSFAVARGTIDEPIITVADLGPAPSSTEPQTIATGPDTAEAATEIEPDTPTETDVAESTQPTSATTTNARVWTSTTGKTVEAELIAVDLKEKKVVLKRTSDGKEVKIPAQLLSSDDQQFVRDWMNSRSK